MTDLYPKSFVGLATWARSNGVTVEEARQRYAQFVVLCGIASVGSLRDHLVFKGRNALDFVLQPNRSTIDLDFSLDMAGGAELANADAIRDALLLGLRRAASRYSLGLTVHSVRQNPRGSDRTFATFEARVGYALPDERQLLIRMANDQPSPHVIPVEVSTNEPISAATHFLIDASIGSLRICTLEDIVGEKLRSLLQQSIRNRNRRQDVLDLAVIIQAHPVIDRLRVADALQLKAIARNVLVSRAEFRNPELALRARFGYEALEATTRVTFIPFDRALAIILDLVDKLPIPAG